MRWSPAACTKLYDQYLRHVSDAMTRSAEIYIVRGDLQGGLVTFDRHLRRLHQLVKVDQLLGFLQLDYDFAEPPTLNIVNVFPFPKV